MATAFPLPVTAAQVGTYFVGQYYQMLQNQPDYAYRFYSEASTVLRIDGNRRESATAMLQIHQLILSLNYTGIEIKTAHSLESWNGGVLVMVSGCVHVKGFTGRRKFMETFFLAPQEKGYFVLNDIFHYVEEEQIVQHPIGYIPQSNLDSKFRSSVVREVPKYISSGEIQPREFLSSAKIEEESPVNAYNPHEEQIRQIPEAEKVLNDSFEVHSNGVLQGSKNSAYDHFSGSIEESIVEPQKHTYASIVAKAHSAQTISQPSSNKSAPPEWHHTSEIPGLPSDASPNAIERSGAETVDEPSAVEDEVEVKSVYVRNVPTTMSASEIGEEFKKFGKLKPDGVAIRTRKDMDACYAFVEFEDVFSVQNAIKASMVEIGEHQLYIEGRRPNRNNAFRGGGRARGGRGRVRYQGGGRSGGRGFYRTSNQDGGILDYDYYSRPRGNGGGLYRQVGRQERAYSGSRNGSE